MNTNNFRKHIATVLSTPEMQQLRSLESKGRNESESQQLKELYAEICTRLMLCTKANAHRYVDRALGGLWI